METIKNICRRIVGGSNVDKIDEYPFMATIWYLEGEEFRFKSGAVYIGGKYFLTAGHCLKNRSIKMMVVRMGSTNLKRVPSTFRVVKAHIHPNFNSKSLINDIAILEVDKEVEYDAVRIPCHHMGEQYYAYGNMVRVLGFGKDNEKSSLEHLLDLKEVDLKIIPVEESKYHRSLITKDMFLAGGIRRGLIVDACTGDSGGPCLMKIGDSYVLMGIVSWGSGCGRKDLPGVYTKVSSFHNWVRNICGFGGCRNH